MKMTSAYAAKQLRKLNEDKDYWLTIEKECSTYISSIDEDPVVPDYDYTEIAGNIEEIDLKIVAIKHALNVSNSQNEVTVGDRRMTIDAVLIRMAQLSKRKATLDIMRKRQPRSRVSSGWNSTSTTDYRYINYDLDLVKRAYDMVDAEVAEMQIALDKYNQTVEFDVDLELL